MERAAAADKPGLIFAGTRKDTEYYAHELADRGFRAAAYHAGPANAQSWLHDELDLPAKTSTNATNLLTLAGVVATTEDGNLAYADERLSTDDAVAQAVERARAYQRITTSRVEMMRAYAETTGCRRQHLLAYLGELTEHPCAHCDTCEAGIGDDDPQGQSDTEHEFPMHARVRHRDWGAGIVTRPEPDRITVLFDAVGYKTVAVEALHQEGLLTRQSSD
ncbi:MAG TPA: RecQ family zinc-binding domain-containing protein [Nocardioidaceae bacterium]|nr:RecQ family zinc-binding domain-containing protein [Nocardioidaceae bacterium]